MSSRVQPFVIPLTVAHHAPLCMNFSRQEYWSGLPFPTPGDLPNPGIEPASLVSPAETCLMQYLPHPWFPVNYFIHWMHELSS